MPTFSIIAFSALMATIVSTFFVIIGRHQLYWIAAIGIYIFSFIAGFSIGQLTVGLTFILLSLAIGYSFHWLRSKSRLSICLSSGVLIGLLMVLFVDDYWLFYPLFKLRDSFS